MLKTIYISGPMTGKENLNREAFKNAAVALVSQGWNVVNPHDVSPGKENPAYNDYMKADLKAMLDCEALYMLDGWVDSKGANIEHDLASQLGFEILYQSL